MTTIVAEIGCNHRGEFATAVRMVEILANYCREHFRLDGVRPHVVAKFQKRTPSLRPDDFTKPHPNPMHSYGASYGAHREALEFSADEHRRLRYVCAEQGIGYAASAWDWQALDDVVSARPAWVKIPSARNRDTVLIERAFAAFDGPVHISVGMMYRREVYELVDRLVALGVSKRAVLYACTSGYPVQPEDVRLGELEWLQRMFGAYVADIGFSGHHHGIAIDMAAVALGASYVERHFTLNRTWRGTDHGASLEPDGMRRLIRDTQTVRAALGMKGDIPLEVEQPQRVKLS